MATSAVMQSIVARPVTRVHNESGFNQITGSTYLHRGASLRVKCTNEDGQMKEEIPIPPPKPSSQKMSTKFGDVLAFSGPAPERINGRLAMIGFASTMLVELNKGGDLFNQISNGGGEWFIGTTVVLTLASLIPFFKGVSVQRVNDIRR